MSEILSGDAQNQLKTIIERLDRLEDDKAMVTGDIKAVLDEAKGNGFDAKIIRKMVRILRQDRAKRLEEEAILELYLAAVEG
jgi:uncharacterized protein (UPF0335 family)